MIWLVIVFILFAVWLYPVYLRYSANGAVSQEDLMYPVEYYQTKIKQLTGGETGGETGGDGAGDGTSSKTGEASGAIGNVKNVTVADPDRRAVYPGLDVTNVFKDDENLSWDPYPTTDPTYRLEFTFAETTTVRSITVNTMGDTTHDAALVLAYADDGTKPFAIFAPGTYVMSESMDVNKIMLVFIPKSTWQVIVKKVSFSEKAEQATTSDAPFDGYIFYPGLDSGGNDIGGFGDIANDTDALKMKCDSLTNCKGFNTNGWLKHTIMPKTSWGKWTSDVTKGFYMKA